MESIRKKYIVNEKNEKVAVQLDIDTFNQIEEALENYGLVKLIEANKEDELLNLHDAEAYYKSLDKAP